VLTFLTNRLCDVLDQVGRNREVARLRKENADLRYQTTKLEAAFALAKNSREFNRAKVVSLRKENALLADEVVERGAKLHAARIRINRLEAALTDAHGTINDLRGDPIAEAIALDTKRKDEARP
jgi:predicted  nucleic acid-binding Zn-ribbon protein